MPLFRQERCTPWAPIRCHADFTSCERQHRLAQHDRIQQEALTKNKILDFFIAKEYTGASESCKQNNGLPPISSAEEVTVSVQYNI